VRAVTDTITIPAAVVPQLRSGALRKLDAALGVVGGWIEGPRDDARAYYKAFQPVLVLGVLIDKIGVLDDSAQHELELDPALSGSVLEALESQYAIELERQCDFEAGEVAIPPRNLPELKTLVDELSKRVGVSAAVRPQAASRRGHG
jgi:hypothetical protein